MDDHERLRQTLQRQARRLEQAGRERPTLLAQTVFLGTLALLFVLPVVGGAYLGHWVDGTQSGYSYRWTMIGLAAGVALGAANVWAYIRSH
jgi:ATP synthase protein I